MYSRAKTTKINIIPRQYSFLFFALGLLAGIKLALAASWWPDVEFLCLAAWLGIFLWRRGWVFLGAVCLGWLWLLVYLAALMHTASPANLAPQTTQVLVGKIQHSSATSITINSRRLSWYPKTNKPQVGETWQLEARLRPLRSLQNFHSQDFSALSLAAGQVEGGYVTPKAQVKKLAAAGRLASWRNKLILTAQEQPAASQTGWKYMLALGLGASNLLSPADWQHLEHTGTLHLWVVSGLHLGLLAGLVLMLGRKLKLSLGLSLTLAASLALGYAQLAGWGVAAQRAAFMLLFGFVVLSGWRQLPASLIFGLALSVLLIANPLLVLSKGLWLSFGAVAVLLLAFTGRNHNKPWWWQLVQVQLVLLLAFTPILVWQGAWFNLWSVPINLILVPLVGLVLLPATLIALALSALGFIAPLEVLAQAFNFLGQALQLMAENSQNPASWWGYFNKLNLHQPAYLWLGCLALLPPGIALRSWAWLGLVLAFMPAQQLENKHDNWQVRVLDVGQGTAVLVESQGQKLLYDTGPGYPSGWVPVISALEPYLQAAPSSNTAFSTTSPNLPNSSANSLNLNATKHFLQQLVISHDDKDHSGGREAVLKRWPAAQEFSATKQNCYAGQTWALGALKVQALWPPLAKLPKNRAENADSCVLLITAPEVAGKFFSLLLTGDAGLAEEAYFSQILPQLLTNSAGERLKLTILISGHHGSKTSTGAALIAAAQPEYAVHTNGWRNSYGHPHSSVVQALRQAQVVQLATASHGAVHFYLQANSLQLSYKNQRPPLWHWLGYKSY